MKSPSLKIPAQMKVARVHQPGGAAFRIEEVATPQPAAGQLLIRVESAGVNFSDIKRRRGDAYPFPTEFPFVPGGEIAGIVVAHGPGVDGPPIGTPVFALAGPNGYGGYAQFAVSYATTAAPIPTGLDMDAAATLLVAGSTAKLMLAQVARLMPGESVLIPAATGGVGSFLVQLARLQDAGKVVAAVGHASKIEQALALGAHHVVDTSQAGWCDRVRALTDGRGVDVALEASGGPLLEQTLQCLAPFGRLVVYGAASGQSATLSQAALERLLYAPAPNQSIAGFNVGGWFLERPAVAGAALGELMQSLLQGKLRVPPIRTLPLGQAQQAHELLESGKSSGKLVLKPWVQEGA